MADKDSMISERQKVLRSVFAIAFSACAVIYSTSNTPSAQRSTASFKSVGNCFKAMKKMLKNYEIIRGGDVSIVTTSGRKLEGKVATYARGGLEIRSSKGNYLVGYGEIQSINDEVLGEIKIYKRLLADDINSIQDKTAQVFFNNGTDSSKIKGRDFEMGEKTLNFTNLEDGRRMTFAYEKIYDVTIIDPAKEAKKIRRDVKLFDGEFVTVETKSGENFDGEIKLSLDGSRADIFDIDDPNDVISIPITDIKSIYQ